MDAIEKLLLRATIPAALFTYPTRFEKLHLDDNTSLWASTTPAYQPMPPLSGTITADLAIIGGGFTGVSTAYHFSRRYPAKRVVILEAKSLANGASGRNGGMMLNWVPGPTPTSEALAVRLYQVTDDAITMIEDIIARHALAVSARRDGSLEAFTDPHRAEAAAQQVERWQALGLPLQFLDGPTLKRTLHLRGAYGAILDPRAGQLNGAQFVRALRPVLLEQGVEIYEGTPVQDVRSGAPIRLVTPQGEVHAEAIVLATNGYTGKLGFFRKALFPLHSHVFATEPLSDAQQQTLGWYATSGYYDDYDRISYSTMTPEGRMVFGGGSNAAYDYQFNNRTAYRGSAKRGFSAMQQTLYRYLPAARDLRITHRWTGTLGVTLSRSPLIGVLDSRIYYALGYSGHGVTLANLAGKMLTDLYAGDDAAWRDLPFYKAAYQPIPLEPFRWLGYHLLTRFTGRSPSSA